MRFCDFFISYKIGLKGIKNSIPFTQLPLYLNITGTFTPLVRIEETIVPD